MVAVSESSLAGLLSLTKPALLTRQDELCPAPTLLNTDTQTEPVALHLSSPRALVSMLSATRASPLQGPGAQSPGLQGSLKHGHLQSAAFANPYHLANIFLSLPYAKYYSRYKDSRVAVTPLSSGEEGQSRAARSGPRQDLT